MKYLLIDYTASIRHNMLSCWHALIIQTLGLSIQKVILQSLRKKAANRATF